MKRPLIILGSICGIATVALLIGVFHSGSVSNRSHYNSEAMTLVEVGLERYLADHGQLPSSSENHLIVDVLTGKNPGQTHYVRFEDQQLNPNREVVDYWKTPLRIIFHSEQSFSVRSAGPDRVFGTEDDSQMD